MEIYRKYISLPFRAVIKLTVQSLYTARDCTGKGLEIAGFIVFGGGKLYIGTANRRKQSTKKLTSCLSDGFFPLIAFVDSPSILICAVNTVICEHLFPDKL